MTNTDMARPSDQALVSDQARSGLDPSGVDPSRVRRVTFEVDTAKLFDTLHATNGDFAPLGVMVVGTLMCDPSFFDAVRMALCGVSIVRSDSDGNPQGGDGTAPSRSDDSAGLKGIAQSPDLSSRDTNNVG